MVTLLSHCQAFRDHAANAGKGDTLTVPATTITLHDELDDYELLLSAPAAFDAQLGALSQLDAPIASRRESISMSVIEDLSAAFGSQPGMEGVFCGVFWCVSGGCFAPLAPIQCVFL